MPQVQRTSVEMQSPLHLPLSSSSFKGFLLIGAVFGSTASFCADQLPVRPSSCGSERRDTTRSEDTDQTVSQQHHPHLPHLFLSVSPDPVDTNPAGTGLRLHCRCVAIKGKWFRMHTLVGVTTVGFLCSRNIQLLPPVIVVDQPELLG